ncbi:MAG: cell division protein FtsZ [Chitinophagales bacterium]|jgi:cell division protein FtsZ|nr:cell division protein FtsZ [Chitinophagales bacterium]
MFEFENKIIDTNDSLEKNKPSIKILGVGGAGNNAVAHMQKKGIQGVDFYIINTDYQHLTTKTVENKILIGQKLTKGLGTGGNPEIGQQAVVESKDKIFEILQNTDMLFLSAGLGKGTGTGATPEIAKIAQELGILTVAVVMMPDTLLGKKQFNNALQGLQALKAHVDSIIIVSNDKLTDFYGEMEYDEAYALADDVLANATKGIAEMVTGAGVVNVDLNDVKNTLRQSGDTVIGIGMAKGESRALSAIQEAINCPLLDFNNVKGATKALINICSSQNNKPTINETKAIIQQLIQSADSDIEIIHGITIDNSLEEELMVTVVVTGFEQTGLTSNPNIGLQKSQINKDETVETNPKPLELLKNDQNVVDIQTFNKNINPSSLDIIDTFNESEVKKTTEHVTFELPIDELYQNSFGDKNIVTLDDENKKNDSNENFIVNLPIQTNTSDEDYKIEMLHKTNAALYQSYQEDMIHDFEDIMKLEQPKVSKTMINEEGLITTKNKKDVD